MSTAWTVIEWIVVIVLGPGAGSRSRGRCRPGGRMPPRCGGRACTWTFSDERPAQTVSCHLEVRHSHVALLPSVTVVNCIGDERGRAANSATK